MNVDSQKIFVKPRMILVVMQTSDTVRASASPTSKDVENSCFIFCYSAVRFNLGNISNR